MSAIVVQVEYQVGGGASEPTLSRLSTAFERAGAEVANIEKHVLPRLVPVFEEASAKQFDAQGTGPQVGTWAELSPRYKAWKDAHYPGKPILERTGAMRAALTSSSAPGALRAIGGNSLTYGTAGVPYASHHQTGTEKMPVRAPFDFGEGTEEAIQRAVAAGVRAAVREGSDNLFDFEGDTFTDDDGTTYAVKSGARGGRYYDSGSGRVYLKKDAQGRAVKRRLGGKR